MTVNIVRRSLCTALAAGMLLTINTPQVSAQSYRSRDEYVVEYYRNNPRDRDYRRWEERRWRDDDYRRWYRRHHRHDHDNNDNLGAAALFGLAAGALASGVFLNQNNSGVLAGRPSASGYAQGSSGWLSYCSSKYRSFDARSGTYLGYDGQRHVCR